MKSYLFSGVLGCWLLVSSASAGEVRIEQVDNGGGDDGKLDLAGTVTNDIRIDALPYEALLSRQMLLVLDAGAVLDHPYGADVPSSASLIDLYPNVVFDSFLATGDTFSPVILGASDKLGLGLRRSPAILEPQVWDALWGPSFAQVEEVGIDGVTDFLIARITLSGDAVGTFKYRVSFSDRNTNEFFNIDLDLPIANGVIGAPEPFDIDLDLPIANSVDGVPEPASLGLAGLAMVGLVGRRRRR